ncbi:hypothetical protein GA0115257_104156 [Streptomyces sp. LcepLS]|nr:hypothetical protein GA0115257_104156 [Streptomyces sp. LcepLS]
MVALPGVLARAGGLRDEVDTGEEERARGEFVQVPRVTAQGTAEHLGVGARGGDGRAAEDVVVGGLACGLDGGAATGVVGARGAEGAGASGSAGVAAVGAGAGETGDGDRPHGVDGVGMSDEVGEASAEGGFGVIPPSLRQPG